MFHISDIKKFKKCPRLYYLSIDSVSDYQPYLRNDEELTSLIIKYLGISDYYLGIRGDDKERVLREINNFEWFVKSRFEYNDLRVKIPFLHKTENGFDLYFTLYALYPHEDDADYYRYNIWVLEKLDIRINNIYIIHLNANYVMGESLDVNELFITSDCFYNIKNHPSSVIKDKIYEKHVDLDDLIADMKNNSLDDYQPVRKRVCKSRNICSFYENCFGKDEKLPDDSIQYLVSSQYKQQMFENGIYHLKDADTQYLEGTRCQYAQIMASRNGGLYYDYYPLKTWLESLKKPIAFIDFEWERYIVPPFSGLKPYDVVCFEYSLHLLSEKGDLKHTTFIGTRDCRKEFIESLINDIPGNASIVAYNAVGAEMIRIRELAEQFPEYAGALNHLLSNFIDMSFPFIGGLIYDTRMRGNYSVKSLLNLVSDCSYHDLAIHNGIDAVYEWRKIDRGEEVDQLSIRQSLIEYCSMDSYTLYLVYGWLSDIIHKKNSIIT